MPLLLHVVSAWLAGLFLAAFAHAAGRTEVVPLCVFLLVVGAVLAVAWPSSRRAPKTHHAAIACAAIASTLIGDAHWTQASTCIALLEKSARENAGTERALPLQLLLNDPATSGAFVAARAQGVDALSRCKVSAWVRVTKGSAPAGATVTISGTVLATQRGLRFDGAIEQVGTGTEPMRFWRARAGSVIDTLFGTRASLVRALLIADQDGIDPQLRDTYAEAGIVHMLSISGLHVSIIAESLLILTTAIRLSRKAASITSLVVIAFYVLLLGAPPSAVRSAVMLGTVLLTNGMQRPVHPWTALALGAWIPTVDPSVVVHLGWQLSVAGMAALVAARDIMRRWRSYERRRDVPRFVNTIVIKGKHLQGWKRMLAREIIAGLFATAITAPLISWHFGRVSIVAPISNILANPVVGFLQPALFLALLLAPLEAVARLVADACVVPLLVLDRIASLAADVPYAAVQSTPGLFGAACAGGAAAWFVRSTASRRMMPGILGAIFLLVLGVWSPVLTGGSGKVELHMIDVGQGDAIALRTPRGRWIVMDAGRSWRGGDAGRRVVVPYLRRRGGEIAAFVLSHAHDDHVGGAASVVEALQPARWIEPAFITTTPSYRAALAAVQRRQIPWRRVHPGDSLIVDGVTLRILGPDSAWTAKQVNANEASVVLLAEYAGTRFLLTGDAEHEEEAWLVEHWGTALAAHVLKLGHHGSRTSSSASFLDAVHPQLGLASVGAGNRYGHPSPETLAALASRSVPVLRSDREGSVVVVADGRRLEVRSRRDRWSMPLQ